MLDLAYLAPNDTAIIQEFFGTFGADAKFTYTLPRGKSMVYIYVCGPGGNGGNGFSAATSTQRGGGGGGSSGMQSRIIVPRQFLGDQLFISLGCAELASNSYVALGQTGNTSSIIVSGQNGGSGGVGSAAAGGSAGTSPSAPGIAAHPLASLGLLTVQSQDASNGLAGGASGAPSAASIGGSDIIMGAPGGAGVTSGNLQAIGGGLTGLALWYPTIAGGAVATSGIDGGVFRSSMGMVYRTAGTGGGSSGAGTGGNGGRGAHGCGGGGGGGGVTGGTGGAGGPGFAIVACF